MRAHAIVARRLGLVLLAGLVSTLQASAQTGLATVTGIVSDESAAAVPGLTVTATNQATNIVYPGDDERGRELHHHRACRLATTSSRRSCRASRASSRRSRCRPRRRRASTSSWSSAPSRRRVEVVATGAVLQTENAVVGTHRRTRADREAAGRQGRNVSSRHAVTTPGTTQPNMSSFNSLSGGGRPFVNGQQQQANNFTLDGVDTNEAINNGIAYQPSPDAVEQVSVETQQLLGRARQRGRRRRQHGDQVGDEPVPRERLLLLARQQAGGDALGHQPRRAARKSEFSRNIFGGTIGGPLLRNKVFFFADYQGGRDRTRRRATPSRRSCPTSGGGAI